MMSDSKFKTYFVQFKLLIEPATNETPDFRFSIRISTKTLKGHGIFKTNIKGKSLYRIVQLLRIISHGL